MTKDEFKLIVKGLKSVYNEQNFIATQAAFDIWYDSLKDLSYRDLSFAAQKYIQTGHFAPKPADLREIVASARTSVADYGDAWMNVMNAIRRYGYMREKEALDSLDPVTRRAAENIGWQNLCMSESPETDRANFRMIYERLASREQEREQISPAVQQIMTQMWAESALGIKDAVQIQEKQSN